MQTKASDFLDALDEYREPKWGCISNMKNPHDHSCDNALLFWATALVHLKRLSCEETQGVENYQRIADEVVNFILFVRACEIEPGLYKRYPGVPEGPTTHDCLTGVAVASLEWGLPFAKDILKYADAHSWNFEPPTFSSRGYVARIPDFPATLRMAAERRAFLMERLLFSVGLIANSGEAREHTSGKCLIYLKQIALFGYYRETDWVIYRWRSAMQRMYPTGLRGIYAIYFGPEHALTRFAPDKF